MATTAVLVVVHEGFLGLLGGGLGDFYVATTAIGMSQNTGVEESHLFWQTSEFRSRGPAKSKAAWLRAMISCMAQLIALMNYFLHDRWDVRMGEEKDAGFPLTSEKGYWLPHPSQVGCKHSPYKLTGNHSSRDQTHVK